MLAARFEYWSNLQKQYQEFRILLLTWDCNQLYISIIDIAYKNHLLHTSTLDKNIHWHIIDIANNTNNIILYNANCFDAAVFLPTNRSHGSSRLPDTHWDWNSLVGIDRLPRICVCIMHHRSRLLLLTGRCAWHCHAVEHRKAGPCSPYCNSPYSPNRPLQPIGVSAFRTVGSSTTCQWEGGVWEEWRVVDSRETQTITVVQG